MVTEKFIDYCEAFKKYIDEDELSDFVLGLMELNSLYDSLEEHHKPKAVALRYCEAFQNHIPENRLGEVVLKILNTFHLWGVDDEKP